MLPESALLKPSTGGGGGGGAPVNASYVTATSNGTLMDERILTGTANQIIITDNGAGSTIVVSTPQDIATTSSPTFDDLLLNGSLTVKQEFTLGSIPTPLVGFPYQISEQFAFVSNSSVFGFAPLSFYPLYDNLPGNLTLGNDGITNFDFECISDFNDKDIGSVSNFYNYLEVLGSGTVDSVICAQYGAVIAGTRNCSENYGLLVGTGHFGTAGTITEDVTIKIQSPTNTVGTTLTTHIGLEMSDQEVGTNSWAILTAGGKVQFGAPSGKNSLVYLQDADVAHGRTSVQPTDVYLKVTSISATAGGALMVGISDADAQPFKVGAYFGVVNPTDTISAFTVDVGKADGGTGITAIGAAETAFQLTNNGSAIFTILGNGAFTGRILESQGADVASANDLTLGADGNAFEITGAVQINAITTTGWINGSTVTLLFSSTPTVKHNTAGGAGTAVILLSGAVDFSATAGDTLMLKLSEIGGTQAWREIARTAI